MQRMPKFKSVSKAHLNLSTREQGSTRAVRRVERASEASVRDLVLKWQLIEEMAATRHLQLR